ncbi:hypothetical protein ACEPAG_9052 [Sanghuangporus baumii]
MAGERASVSDESAIKEASSKDAVQVKPNPIISRVSPEDLPVIVESELLSFTGIASEEALARRLHPFRADLTRARIRVPLWPDFLPTLQRYGKSLKDERNVMLKAATRARREDWRENGSNTVRHVTVGMAWLRLPSPPNAGGRNSIKVVKDLTVPYVSKALDRLENTLYSGADGTDFAFLGAFKAEVLRARREVESQSLQNRPYASLELIFVHPAYRRTGAGAALLSSCIEMAESYTVTGSDAGLPILLESTCAATPLYTRFGFREVYRSRIKNGGNNYEWPVMLRDPTGKDRKGPLWNSDV